MITKEIINDILKGAYTEEGIKRWWKRKRPQLGNQTPEDIFKKEPEKIYQLAEQLKQ